jgi:hypothetical protein
MVLGEDETGWSRQGGVNFIMDNVILGNVSSFFATAASATKVKEMIVVMDNGYVIYQHSMWKPRSGRGRMFGRCLLCRHESSKSGIMK